MYKILVVDDEAVVREGIRDNIEWDELGFSLAGVCENGSEAMEAVDRAQPEVVLTDICMPFVDGLELTRYISGKYPSIKVIILTGFDEFEYAQQAVRLKAYDFILKPITASELRDKLRKLKEDLDAEKQKLEDIGKLRLQVVESLPLLRERFLNRMVSGNLSEADKNKLDFFNISFTGDNFVAAVIDVEDYGDFATDHPDTDDELLLFAVFNISEEIVSRYEGGLVFQNPNEKSIAVLSGDARDVLRDKAVCIFEELRQTLEKYLKITVSIGIGNVCTGIKEIKTSYKRAVSALDYRFLLGKNRVIYIGDMEDSMDKRPSYNTEWEKKLILGIKTGTTEEIGDIVGRIIQSLKESNVSLDNYYILMQHLIISIIDSLSEAGVNVGELLKEKVNPLTDIYRMKTLADVEVWLKDFCNRASGYITSRRDNYSMVQAIKAEEYIKENYMDQDLSLNSLCKHLLMSVSYFSMVFKNHTGETFIEYLTRVRMEKAVELLKTTDLKSYEVADRVGYADPHYFGLIFKKATGMTPIECRERNQ